MGNTKVNILNIIVPVLLLIGTMLVSLIDYPSVFEKSKLTVITVFVAAIIYVIIWIYLKPDRFSRNGGLIIGLLFIINISIEEFISWQTKIGSVISTLTMMFLIFISFSIISVIKTTNTENIKFGIKSSFVNVSVDNTGRNVSHACASVSINGRDILVDPAYQTFDIIHKKYRPVSDSEAIRDYQSWRHNLGFFQWIR